MSDLGSACNRRPFDFLLLLSFFFFCRSSLVSFVRDHSEISFSIKFGRLHFFLVTNLVRVIDRIEKLNENMLRA